MPALPEEGSPDIKETPPTVEEVVKMNVPDAVAVIERATRLDSLRILLTAERVLRNRKSIITAVNNRLEELTEWRNVCVG